MIIYGSYNFFRKRLGYRKDYCLSCEAEVVSERYRSVDFLHLFWVPFLPLGVWKRWLCRECGEKPHERVKTGKGMKIVGAFLLLLFTIVAWSEPVGVGSNAIISWMLRVILPLGALGTFYSSFKSTPSPDLGEKLKALSPFPDDNCLYCETQLVRVPAFHCPKCGIVRDESL